MTITPTPEDTDFALNQANKSDMQCPYNCLNRRKDGINLVFFGNHAVHFDPFEILLFFLIATLPVGLSLRDAWDNKLSFRESIERIAMISGLGALVRLSPTEQISNFLSNYQLGKK